MGSSPFSKRCWQCPEITWMHCQHACCAGVVLAAWGPAFLHNILAMIVSTAIYCLLSDMLSALAAQEETSKRQEAERRVVAEQIEAERRATEKYKVGFQPWRLVCGFSRSKQPAADSATAALAAGLVQHCSAAAGGRSAGGAMLHSDQRCWDGDTLRLAPNAAVPHSARRHLRFLSFAAHFALQADLEKQVQRERALAEAEGRIRENRENEDVNRRCCLLFHGLYSPANGGMQQQGLASHTCADARARALAACKRKQKRTLSFSGPESPLTLASAADVHLCWNDRGSQACLGLRQMLASRSESAALLRETLQTQLWEALVWCVPAGRSCCS